MPREILQTDGGGNLSQEDINLAIAQEVARYSTTVVNNALINSGAGTPTSVVGAQPFSQPMTVAGQTDGVVPVTNKPINQMTPEELKAYQQNRLATITKTRETGGGTEPPYAAPAGTHWSFIGGKWTLYKDFVSTGVTGGGGGGGGGGTGGGTGGSTTTTTVPATPTGPTLAINTFKTTLGLFFGQAEMSKAWVDELYKLTSPYYKSGSTVDEALNLALQEGRNNPNLKEFTTRFKGIFDLQDKLVSGQAVTVPTIAEFIASEAKMGDVLNQAGLGSLNNQTFLGDIIGKGVNVTEFTNRINNVFLRIDQMPQQAKDFISSAFPTLDKAQLAKSILTGDKGAVQLSKELGGMEVQAAAKAQGLNVGSATGLDIAALGYDYGTSMTGFGQVAQALPTYEKLMELRTGTNIESSDVQSMLQQSIFNKNIAEQEKLRKEAELEAARFQARSGNIGSKAFASQQRGAGLI